MMYDLLQDDIRMSYYGRGVGLSDPPLADGLHLH